MAPLCFATFFTLYRQLSVSNIDLIYSVTASQYTIAWMCHNLYFQRNMFWLSSVFYYQDNTVSNVSVQIHLYSFSSLDKLQEGE